MSSSCAYAPRQIAASSMRVITFAFIVLSIVLSVQSYGLLRKLQKGNAYFEEEFPPIGQKRGLYSLVLALKQRRSASSSQDCSRGRDLLRQEIHPTPNPSPKPLLNPPLKGRTSSSLVLPDLQSGRMEFQHLQCDLMFAGLQIPIPNAGGLQIRPNGSLYTPTHSPSAPSHPPQREKPPPILPRGGVEPMA